MKKIFTIVVSFTVFITTFTSCTKEEVYRLIKVNNYEGAVTVEREEKMNVFDGLQLISEDTVEVGEDSLLELLADSDKHIIAEEKTRFKLHSTGTESNGKITIDLLYGSSLITIDNKLPDDSYFILNTPNTTLSVRGTTFTASYNADEEKTTATVTEGVVEAEWNGGEYSLEKGDEIIITGSDDNIEAVINSSGAPQGTELLFSLTKTYSQNEGYLTAEGEHYLSVSDYTAKIANLSETSMSDSNPGNNNPLLSPTFIIKGIVNFRKDEVNKFFESNKSAAVSSKEKVDVTDWFSKEIQIKDSSFTISKVFMEISLSANSTAREYYTSDTYAVIENGRQMYYYASGVNFTFYGTTGEESNVITAAVTTAATEPMVREETIGFQVTYNKFHRSLKGINDLGYSGYVYHNHYPEGYTFDSLYMIDGFSEVVDVIEDHNSYYNNFYEENYKEENRFSANLTENRAKESVAEWFEGKVLTVTDDNGRSLKIRITSANMILSGGSTSSDNTPLLSEVPSEYILQIGESVYYQNSICYGFYATVIEKGEPTTSAPVTTTTVTTTTTIPVTTASEMTETTEDILKWWEVEWKYDSNDIFTDRIMMNVKYSGVRHYENDDIITEEGKLPFYVNILSGYEHTFNQDFVNEYDRCCTALFFDKDGEKIFHSISILPDSIIPSNKAFEAICAGETSYVVDENPFEDEYQFIEKYQYQANDMMVADVYLIRRVTSLQDMYEYYAAVDITPKGKGYQMYNTKFNREIYCVLSTLCHNTPNDDEFVAIAKEIFPPIQ